MSNEKISFKIISNIGLLAKSSSGWSKEVNIVSWNNGPAKLDIRDWSEDHTKMSRGITLSASETQRLVASINARNAVKILNEVNNSSRIPQPEL